MEGKLGLIWDAVHVWRHGYRNKYSQVADLGKLIWPVNGNSSDSQKQRLIYNNLWQLCRKLLKMKLMGLLDYVKEHIKQDSAWILKAIWSILFFWCYQTHDACLQWCTKHCLDILQASLHVLTMLTTWRSLLCS